MDMTLYTYKWCEFLDFKIYIFRSFILVVFLSFMPLACKKNWGSSNDFFQLSFESTSVGLDDSPHQNRPRKWHLFRERLSGWVSNMPRVHPKWAMSFVGIHGDGLVEVPNSKNSRNSRERELPGPCGVLLFVRISQVHHSSLPSEYLVHFVAGLVLWDFRMQMNSVVEYECWDLIDENLFDSSLLGDA